MEKTYGSSSAIEIDVFERHILGDPLHCLRVQMMVIVGPGTPLGDVVHVLSERGRGAALVVEEGRLIGIFGERDLLMRLADREDDWRQVPVSDFMTPDPITLPPDASIAFALNRMNVGDYRHIPIVDDHGSPLGVVSVKDIVAYLHDYVASSAVEAEA